MHQRASDFLFLIITIILQFILSMAVVFLFSMIFAKIDTHTRLGWLAVIAGIWIGFTVGICAGGWIMRLLRKQPLRARLSLWLTAAAAVIPLFILIFMSLRFEPILEGEAFNRFIASWQPTLAQFSLLTGLFGFHVSGWRH
jgi:hypothetical protein